VAKVVGKWVGTLLIFFGLFLNPFVLGSLFSNNGSIESVSFLGLIVGIETLFFVLGSAILKTKDRLLQNVGISVISVVIVSGTTISADRVYGRFLMPETANLLFPAFSRAEHHTSEFKLDVRINNLGFRGANTTIEKTRKRVMVIGDSFTFGWGVEQDETWVHLLSEKYPSVEFLNLGQGGNHPGDFVRIAKRAIPLLKPDLVMVAILQGNDLHQLMRVIEFEESGSRTDSLSEVEEPTQEKLRRWASILFPNLVTRLPRKVSMRDAWLMDAKALLASINEEQKTKYRSLNENLREQFESGRLNPSLIYESVHHPDMFRTSVDTNDPLCSKAITRLHDHLVELRELAEENEAEMIILSLPNRPYGFHETLKPLAELGFDVDGCDTLNADFAFYRAVTGLNASVLSPQLDAESYPYYTYDGHWNTAGNRIFARQLYGQLDTLPLWKHSLTSSDF